MGGVHGTCAWEVLQHSLRVQGPPLPEPPTHSPTCVLGLKNTGFSAPAYPAPIVRFITMTCLARHTSMTGMPAGGRRASACVVGGLGGKEALFLEH
jgi:hypothetical protein